MNFDCNANMQKESELLPVIVSVFCSFCLKIILGHGACLVLPGFFDEENTEEEVNRVTQELFKLLGNRSANSGHHEW